MDSSINNLKELGLALCIRPDNHKPSTEVTFAPGNIRYSGDDVFVLRQEPSCGDLESDARTFKSGPIILIHLAADHRVLG